MSDNRDYAPGDIVSALPPSSASEPTAQLRFIERAVAVNGDLRMLRMLQQAWIVSSYREGVFTRGLEWRDVPLVTE